jgi:acetyltransferase
VNTDLSLFFNPRSIAIVGASPNPEIITGRTIKYLQKHNYQGVIYPVNPKYNCISGLRCYPSIEALPESPDHVLIIVRADRVMGVLVECAHKKVPFVTIVSSGFAEESIQGREKQEEIRDFARQHNLRVCGPNSQGMVNLRNFATSSFSASLDLPDLLSGPVGFVSQSGAFCYSTFCLAQEYGLGFSYVVSTGNEADLDSCDFIEFMLRQSDINVVASYMEGITDGEKMVRVAELSQQLKKPVIILKVGRSEIGKKAVSSHTGAITGSDRVFSSVCRQFGFLRVEDIGDFFDVASIFLSNRNPVSRRVGVVSTSGGAGVMMVDKLTELGIEIPDLTRSAEHELEKIIPSFGTRNNPVDVTAEVVNNPVSFRTSLEIVAGDPNVDIICVIMTMITGELAEKLAEMLSTFAGNSPKPLVLTWSVPESMAPAGFETIKKARIPLFPTPVRAAKAIAKWIDFLSFDGHGCDSVVTQKTPGFLRRKEEAVSHCRSLGGKFTEQNANKLLSLYEISFPAEEKADSAAAAVSAAKRIGFPVALKILSPDIRHKTDVGGLVLNLHNTVAVAQAYDTMMANVKKYNPAAAIDGVLVQEMVDSGTEVVLGSFTDKQFGPVIMFGLGGIFIETLKDVEYRRAPLSKEEALKMITQIKGYALLQGARNKPAGDLGVLAETLVRFSWLAYDLWHEIEEMEINPLVVLPAGKGVRAVDLLIVG